MKSSIYWPQRQEELAAALEKDEAALKRRLLRQYEAEAAKLEREIAAYYKRYGEDNIVKYADLFKKLPDSDIMFLIQRMDEFEKKYPEYADLMPIRESIYKLNRLEGLQQSIRLQQRELGAITNRELKEHLASLAYKSTGAADKIMGLAVNSSAMKLFSGTAWSGEADFSQRIWQNTDKLAEYLNNDIANGFARGDSYERLIKNVRSRFINVAKNDAYRLVYTEGTYVMNESSAAVFAEDFEDYEFQVADNNACPVCKALNGKKFKFSQRVPGRNFPPMHPWCRCHYGVAVADWDKWQDEYVKKHGGKGSSNRIISSFKGAGTVSDDYDNFKQAKKTVIGTAKTEAEKKAFIDAFIKKYENAEFENMLMIDKNGAVHLFESDYTAGIYYDEYKPLFKGSYNIHNHPRNETQYTFSPDQDVYTMFEEDAAVMEAFDYKYIYHMERAEGVTFEKWDEARCDAEQDVSNIMFERGYALEEYEEQRLHLIIEEACRKCGMNYYRRKR